MVVKLFNGVIIDVSLVMIITLLGVIIVEPKYWSKYILNQDKMFHLFARFFSFALQIVNFCRSIGET